MMTEMQRLVEARSKEDWAIIRRVDLDAMCTLLSDALKLTEQQSPTDASRVLLKRLKGWRKPSE